MSYLGPLSFLVALLASCGAGTTTNSTGPPSSPTHAVSPVTRKFALQSGATQMFQPGALRPGDVVTCKIGGHRLHIRVPNRPDGGWDIASAAATPDGSTRQLELKGNTDGSVTAVCGANP